MHPTLKRVEGIRLHFYRLFKVSNPQWFVLLIAVWLLMKPLLDFNCSEVDESSYHTDLLHAEGPPNIGLARVALDVCKY